MIRLINLIVEAAKILNAEYQPVQLSSVREKVLSLDRKQRYKESSYNAELNYHTINMKSRFFDKKEKESGAAARWKSEPYFYRTSPGFYRLLSDEDKRIFNLALKNDLDIVYKDEYTLELLYSRVENLNLNEHKINTSINDGSIDSNSKIFKTKNFMESFTNKKVHSSEYRVKIYSYKEKDILLNKIGEFLIKIYNNNKIPKYLGYHSRCGFTVNNLINDQNYLFRLLIFAAYDQGPYTGAAKGWEPIWGIAGSQKLPEILKNLELFSLEDIQRLSVYSINEKLSKVTFFNYRIDQKNSVCPQYAKTFITIYRKIKEDSLLDKFIEANSRAQILNLFENLKQIENIGETIASKIIMYVLREIHLNNISNSCFSDVAKKIMGEFHNNRLIKELDNYYFKGFSDCLYDELVKNGDPYAIDALYYIDRDERSLKRDLFY